MAVAAALFNELPLDPMPLADPLKPLLKPLTLPGPWYCCAPRLRPLCCCETWLSFFKMLFLLAERLVLALLACCSFLFSFIMSSNDKSILSELEA